MPEYHDIDELVRGLRDDGPPPEEDTRAARLALQAAIAAETRRPQRRRVLVPRLAVALGSLVILAGLVLASAVFGEGPTVASSLDVLAASSSDGALVGSPEGTAAEVPVEETRLVVGADGTVMVVTEWMLVRTEADGTRRSITADPDTGAALSEELPDLPNPQRLSGEPADVIEILGEHVDETGPIGGLVSVLDVAAEVLTDPRLTAEQRAAVVRSLEAVPGLERLPSGTGSRSFSLASEVGGTSIVTTISFGFDASVTERRVVVIEPADGVAAGSTVYAARYGSPRLVPPSAAEGGSMPASVPETLPGPAARGGGDVTTPTLAFPPAVGVLPGASTGGADDSGSLVEDGSISDVDPVETVTTVGEGDLLDPVDDLGDSVEDTSLTDETLPEVTTTTIDTSVTSDVTVTTDVTVPDADLSDATTTDTTLVDGSLP